MRKLAVFEMDGTGLEKKSSWQHCTKAFGTSHIGLKGLELYK